MVTYSNHVCLRAYPYHLCGKWYTNKRMGILGQGGVVLVEGLEGDAPWESYLAELPFVSFRQCKTEQP